MENVNVVLSKEEVEAAKAAKAAERKAEQEALEKRVKEAQELVKGDHLMIVSEYILSAGVSMASGNFEVVVQGKVSDDMIRGLIEKGLRYEVERGGLSAAYLALAGLPGKKPGSLKLPEGFERKRDAKFSEESAEVMAKALRATMEKLGKFEVRVGEYVAPDAGEGQKQATAMYEKFLAQDKLDKLALMQEWEAEEWTREDWIKAIHGEFFKK